MEDTIVLGVDIGGSHITTGLVNLETRMLLTGTKVREYVNSNGSSEEVITAWSKVMMSAFDDYPALNKKIGIAIPGPFDYEAGISLIKNQNKYDSLFGLNVKELLALALSIKPDNIRLLNDAESFLKGEVFCGAAQGVNKAFALTLGTGLGSAIYSNDKVKDADLWCSDFKNSIAEDYLSTRWFTSRYEQLTGYEVKDVKELVDFHASEKETLQLFNEFGKNFSEFLRKHVAIEEPEIVVLAGNICNTYELFAETLLGDLAGHNISLSLKRSLLGEEAGLMGAASCWYQPEANMLTS